MREEKEKAIEQKGISKHRENKTEIINIKTEEFHAFKVR